MIEHDIPSNISCRKYMAEKLFLEIQQSIEIVLSRYSDYIVLGDNTALDLGSEIRKKINSTSAAAKLESGAALQGHHFRAGRALIKWTRADLAEASGVSVSTVRRIEQDADFVLERSRGSAAEALRIAGVGFLDLDNGTVAVVLLAEEIPQHSFDARIP